MSTKRIVRIGLFTAIALILSLIENAFPPLLAFAPGVKMGLSNVVCLIALIILGYGDAYAIFFLKCVLSAVFGGNITSLLYSLPSGTISLALEILLYHFCIKRVSLMSVSLAGAAVFNMCQLAVASVIVQVNLFAVLPLMLLASVIAGVFVGFVAFLTIKFLPKGVYIDKQINYRHKKRKLKQSESE